MEKITLEEVKRLANLSALEFEQEELEKFATEFEGILEMIDEIKKCDVSMKQTYKSHKFDCLREDVPQESLSQEKALAGSPKIRKGAFAVSQMLEED